MRRIASQQLIRHCAERVDVRACIDDAITGRLLGGHVFRRAEGQTCLCDAPAARITYSERNSEIRDERLSFM